MMSRLVPAPSVMAISEIPVLNCDHLTKQSKYAITKRQNFAGGSAFFIARLEISVTVTAYLRYANQRCCSRIKKLVCYSWNKTFALLLQPSGMAQKNPPFPERNRGRMPIGSNYLFWMYSWMALAAALPAPMALMTVAAPVTASPPAYTPSRLVLPSSPSVTMQPCLLVSRPGVVEGTSTASYPYG